MFAEQDVREILRLVPLEDRDSRSTGALPPLVLTSSGNTFRTGKSLVRDFEGLVKNEPSRLSVTSLGHSLDVSADVVLQLVHTHPKLALLSEDELRVIATEERNSISRTLGELLGKQLVSKTDFSRRNDVSEVGIDLLINSYDEDTALSGTVREANGFLLSDIYERTVSDVIKGQLDSSTKSADAIEMSSSSLPGSPPMWYIRECLPKIVKKANMGAQFRIDEDNDVIRCIPKEALQRRRDTEVSQLQSGAVLYLDLESFATGFKEFYPSYQEAKDYLSTMPSIYLCDTFAISTVWISNAATDHVRDLDEKGYVECVVPSDIPQAIQEAALERLSREIVASYTQRTQGKVHRVASFILTAKKWDEQGDVISDLAEAQALRQWKAIQENQDKTPKPEIADVLTAIPPEKRLLRTIVEEMNKGSDLGLDFALSYWQEMDKLEAQNQIDFSKFWSERVLSKTHNYDQPLKAVEDTKLHDQLADLLSTHLQKELLVDAVAKARSQGHITARRTRANIRKLETVLKGGKLDLTGVLSAIEKFSSKQGVPEAEPTRLEEAKATLVHDMVRRMHKPKTDGPLLFLTLIIVLFARHYPGVLYATGKFAPKLLKQLKSKLSVDAYEQLDKWKELAKSGALTTEDREAMIRMAEEG